MKLSNEQRIAIFVEKYKMGTMYPDDFENAQLFVRHVEQYASTLPDSDQLEDAGDVIEPKKETKYLVLKWSDIDKALTPSQKDMLSTFCKSVREYRLFTKRAADPNYIICNEDESYAGKVWDVVLEGEKAKQNIHEDKLLPDLQEWMNMPAVGREIINDQPEVEVGGTCDHGQIMFIDESMTAGDLPYLIARSSKHYGWFKTHQVTNYKPPERYPSLGVFDDRGNFKGTFNHIEAAKREAHVEKGTIVNGYWTKKSE